MAIVKKTIWVFGIAVLMMVGAAFILPEIIDINDYKDKIEQLAKDSLGREVHLEGKLELKMFPGLRIKTGALSLANPDGFPQPNMLEIDSAEIGIKIIPLLFKRVEAGAIKINRLNLNLTKKLDGQTNWDLAGESEQSTDNKNSDSSNAALAVLGFNISDTTINYSDFTSGTLLKASKLNITTGSIIPGKAFGLNITTDISGTMLPEPLQAEANAQLMIDSSLKNLTISQFKGETKLAESITKLDIEKMAYSIEQGSLKATNLTLNNDDKNKVKTSLMVPDLDFDTNQLLVNLNNLQAQYTAQDTNALTTLAGIKLDLNTLTAQLTPLIGKVTIPDLSANFSLPSTTLDLNADVIELEKISGYYQYQQLEGQINIPKAGFNKAKSSVEIKNIFIGLAKQQIQASISGQISPLKIDFTLDTENLDGKNILKLLGSTILTSEPTALTDIDLSLSGTFVNNSLEIQRLNGALDQSTFNGNAAIINLDDPAYQIKLNLSELALDDYLPSIANDTDATKSKANIVAATTTPIALSKFNLVADISVERIFSKSIDASLENLKLTTSPNEKAHSIDLSGDLSIASLPEAVNIHLQTDSSMDMDKQQANLSNLKLMLKGKTINGNIAIPNAKIPFNINEITLNGITAKLDSQLGEFDLTIPTINYQADNASILVKDISGQGRMGQISSTILLPNLTADLNNKLLAINELALDFSGEKPVGRLSVPTLNINLDTATLGATNITFEGKDGRADIILKPGSIANTYEGSLNAQNFNLRGLLGRFNILTDLADSDALTQVNIQSPIILSDSLLNLAKISAKIDGTPITGHLKANTGLKPDYDFNIKVGSLDADKYLSASKTNKNGTSSSAKAVAAPIPIPIALLKNTTANGKLQFENLKISGADFENLNITVTAKNGKVIIDPLSASFFNGQMNGELQLDSSVKIPALGFDYSLAKISLAPALKALGVTDKLSGLGDFSLKLNTQGTDDQSMLRNSSGAANITVKDGEIQGFNLQDILYKGYQAYTQLKNKTADSKYDPANKTAFSSLTGSWSINKGIVFGDDLSIQAPGFRVTGKGSVSLIKSSIDYLLNVTVVKSLEGQGGKSLQELTGRTIPLKISGSLANPSYKLDISHLLKSELKNQAKEKLQKKLEEKIGEKLEGEGSFKEKVEEKVIKELLDIFN